MEYFSKFALFSVRQHIFDQMCEFVLTHVAKTNLADTLEIAKARASYTQDYMCVCLKNNVELELSPLAAQDSSFYICIVKNHVLIEKLDVSIQDDVEQVLVQIKNGLLKAI